MNDERLGNAIGAFYKETEEAPPDPRQSADRIMADVPAVRQARRRRWLPSFRHRLDIEPSMRSAAYETAPMPPTNGRTHHAHTPTVIGRTLSMFSPAKAVAAGALLFALGGALLIAQPFQQTASVPGAATPRLVDPVEVSGTAEATGCSDEESYEDGNVSGYRNLVCTLDVRMSDERITGLGTRTLNEDWYIDESGEEYPVSTGARTLVIENEGGAWRQRPVFWFETDWTTEPGTEVIVLDGDGDYQDFVALLEVTMHDGRPWEYRGFIFDGELPPAPGP